MNNLTHPTLVSFITRVINRKGQQLASKWSKKLHLIQKNQNPKKGGKPKKTKNKKIDFACGTCGTEFNSMKKLNDHPILKLSCKDTGCESKTNKTKCLVVHSKEIHERKVCKYCNALTIGFPHREDHEKTVHGTDITEQPRMCEAFFRGTWP